MKLKSHLLETLYTCSLWYDLSNFNSKLKFWPQFHGPLNIENYSASGASVYYGHILVWGVVRFPWLHCQNSRRNHSDRRLKFPSRVIVTLINLKKQLATMVSYNMLLAIRISMDTHSTLSYVGRIVPFLLEYHQLRICKSVMTKAFPR